MHRFTIAWTILVGNKCDLKEERVVTTLMGQVSNKITTFIEIVLLILWRERSMRNLNNVCLVERMIMVSIGSLGSVVCTCKTY